MNSVGNKRLGMNFVDIHVVVDMPYLIAALRKSYLEHNCIIKMTHANNNNEMELQSISEVYNHSVNGGYELNVCWIF